MAFLWRVSFSYGKLTVGKVSAEERGATWKAGLKTMRKGTIMSPSLRMGMEYYGKDKKALIERVGEVLQERVEAAVKERNSFKFASWRFWQQI